MYVFLTVLEAGRSKTKVPADAVTDEHSLPSLQTAAFLLSHCVLTGQRERQSKICAVSSDRGINPITGGSTLIASSNPNHLQDPILNTIARGLGLQHEFGEGGTNIQPITKSISMVWF